MTQEIKVTDHRYIRENDSGVEFRNMPNGIGSYVNVTAHLPENRNHVATKAYIDAVIRGLTITNSVKLASTQSEDISTLLESGDDVDGLVVFTGELVLLKDQADPLENGIYVVDSSGEPTRVSESMLKVDNLFYVEQGTANQNKFFKVVGNFTGPDSSPVYGVDAIAFEELDIDQISDLNNFLNVKQSVRTTTDADIDLLSAPAIIGGVTLSVGERVLIKNQIAGEDNGIYIFNGAGDEMTRSVDADSSAKVMSGMYTFVETGDYEDTGWILTTDNPIELGVTALVFEQFDIGALSPNLVAISNIAPAMDQVIVGNGTTWVGHVANIQQVLFVSKNGNDSNNGSFIKPFLTINAAINSISDNSTSKRYVIFVQAGQYDETALAIKPWVYLVGYGYGQTRITVSSNQVTLGTGWGSNARTMLRDLHLTGTTGLELDFSALASASAVIDLYNIWVNGPINFFGRPLGADFLQMYNVLPFAAVVVRNAQGFSNSCMFQNTLVLETTAAGTQAFWNSYGDVIENNITITGFGSFETKATFTGGRLNGVVSASGTNAAITVDSVSYPQTAPSLTSGAQLVLRSKTDGINANHVGTNYTPASIDLKAHLVGIDAALGVRQPLDGDLTTIAALTHSANNVIFSDGTNWTSQSLYGSLNSVPTGAVLFGNTDGNLTFDGTNLIYDTTLDRLGIRATTPATALHVGDLGTAAPTNLTTIAASHLHLGQNLGTVGSLTKISFGPATGIYAPVYIGYQTVSASGANNGDFVIATRSSTSSNTSPTQRLFVRAAGTIDIPTTNLVMGNGTAIAQVLGMSNSSLNSPAFSFTNDVNSGLHLNSLGELGVIGQGQNILRLDGVGTTAVNHITIRNAISGEDPVVLVNSPDADRNLIFAPTGTGTLSVGTSSNYADRIVNDNDIPNRKFVVDHIENSLDVLSVIQGRKTSDVTLGTAYAAIDFDTTDVETNSAIINHNGTDVTILKDGVYEVSYLLSINRTGLLNTGLATRIYVNGTSSDIGAIQEEEMGATGDDFIAGEAILQLSANDVINIYAQAFAASAVDVKTGSTVKVKHLANSRTNSVAVEFNGTSILNNVSVLNFRGEGKLTAVGTNQVNVDLVGINTGLRTNIYNHAFTDAAFTTSATTTNTIIATPLFLPPGETINRIGVEVTTLQAGGDIRLGLYEDDNGVPGDLILDAGTVSTATTGNKEITISHTTSGRMIWAVAFTASATAQCRVYSSPSFGHIIGRDAMGSNAVVRCITRSLAYGPLPTPFGTPVYNVTSINPPVVWVRKV